ncbi:MAG: hypothetical protein CMJ81_08770 [Planctomycetaceae bacterium]|nr:hypothetical protein [Planctomycetaceae bacterium]MBP61920.1 hypothetical protein [Planctomycetaceae bacterium]
MTKQTWRLGVSVFYFWTVLAPWPTAGDEFPRPLQRGVVSTFSIVACDLKNRQWGVATQSRVLAVGSIVPFAQAEVGAVATQSWANTSFGPQGLKMLNAGHTARETLDELLQRDEGRDQRQVAIVDRLGRVAHFTGEECLDWAGARTGENFCCLGNILTGEEVVEAMAGTFQKTVGPLADKMMSAMAAGQAAGGDRRGRQSAALLIVQEMAGYSGFDDRYIDLRVDDHPRPIEELGRLLKLRFPGNPAK